MGRVQKGLQSCLESILIWVKPAVNVALNRIESCDQVHGWLLIACWRRLKICQSALELQSVVVVLNEACCDVRIEGYADEAIMDIASKENVDWSLVRLIPM